ncbi:hypothetical protein H9P43_008967 [Blastocladiella emersonii ATCC 22665]|nr:hypothetical protein H9P43_008967 [Blastocladiella emersonii ATCC 22665]
MNEFAFLPAPPKGNAVQADISQRLATMDLLQRTTLVLIEYPTNPPSRVIRMVPVGDAGPYLPSLTGDETAGIGVLQQPVILAHSDSFSTLMRLTRTANLVGGPGGDGLEDQFAHVGLLS